MSSIIHVGIEFDTKGLDQTSTGIRALGRMFYQAEREASQFVKTMNQTELKLNSFSKSLRSALRRNWSELFNELEMKMMGDTERVIRTVSRQYDRLFRDLGNKYQSMVMGSVALSMSGIGIKETGRAITGFLDTALRQAEDYELITKQIQFYGNVTADQMRQINKEVFKLGRDLPVTTAEVGKATLQAIKTGYSNVNEAVKLAKEASKIQFLSMDKLTGDESLKFFSYMLKLTDTAVEDAEKLTDMLTKTVDVSALEMDTLWRAIQSTRSAKANLKLDNASYLALVAGMGNVLQARGAGEALNVFSRGMLQAFGSEADTKRGQLWRMLGIDLEKEGNDMLKVIDKIIDRSKELWGDTFTRREKLQDIFGNEALTLITAAETNRARSGMTLVQMREQIQQSYGSGYSDKAIETLMNSLYGLRKQFEAVREQFFILFGMILAPGFSKLLKQVTAVIERINMFLEQHPKIAAALGYGAGLAGLLMIATGSLMIFSGAVIATVASIKAFIVNLARMDSDSFVATLANMNKQIKESGVQFGTAGDMIKKRYLRVFEVLGKMMRRSILWVALFSIAWKYNLMGTQTIITNFFRRLQTSFNSAEQVMETFRTSSVEGFHEAFARLADGTKWGRFSQFLVKVQALILGLGEAWNDLELSEDMYKKLEKAGVLPTLTAILLIKEAFKDLWKGFVSGLEGAAQIIMPFLRPIWDFTKNLTDWILNLLDHFGFIEKVNGGVSTKWQEMGQRLGVMFGLIVGIRWTIRAWATVLGIPLKIIGWILRKGEKLSDIFKKIKKDSDWRNMGKGIGGGLLKIAGTFGKLLKSLAKFMFINPQTIFLGKFLKEFSNRVRRQGTVRVPTVSELNPPDFATNRQKYQYNERYGGRELILKKGEPIRVRSKGFMGRIKDFLFGPEIAYTQTQSGRWGVEEIDKKGKRTFRFASREEVDLVKQGKVPRKGGLMGLLRGGFGFVRDAGKMGFEFGKNFLGGIGKLLLKGLPFIFKLAIRALPILGWVTMLWEAILLVFTNWEAIKSAAASAWKWITTTGLQLLGQFWEWLKTNVPIIISETWNWIKTNVPQVFSFIISKFLEFGNWLIGKGLEFGSNLWNNFKNVAYDVFQKIAAWIKDLLTFDINIPEFDFFGKKFGGGVLHIGITGLNFQSSHVGSKVTREGLVNVAPGEVILRDKTVRDFEALIEAHKSADRMVVKEKDEPSSSGSSAPTTVVFEKGAIQITPITLSPAEAEKFANMVMEKIKRKLEVENMRNYRPARARG